MKTKNGETPAHPINDGNSIVRGLTKREYFAAMAMQGLLSDPSMPICDAIKTAVDAADALLKELETNK